MATQAICKIENCIKKVVCRGWCNQHYRTWAETGSPIRFPRAVKICSVDGCSEKAASRGWCTMHYTRWKRTGDPLKTKPQPAPHRDYFETVVLAYEGDECFFWPYGRDPDGYAIVGRGKGHRLACIAANGPLPPDKPLATHSCGNGHLGCVTKRHMSWKSPAGNSRDMVDHGRSLKGEKHSMAVLDEAKVRQIRALAGTTSQLNLGKMFGVSQGAIWRIHNRKTWSWLE
jgi:hypothetical protein